jgi:hypothetical protein
MIEMQEGETITAFTMRRIRAEIIEECARVAEGMAADQERTNAKYPDHAKSYATWRNAVHCYHDVARQIRKLTLVGSGKQP